MVIDRHEEIREIVRQHPDTVPVFEAVGIDYRCGGGVSLEAVCRQRDISIDRVLSDLASA